MGRVEDALRRAGHATSAGSGVELADEGGAAASEQGAFPEENQDGQPSMPEPTSPAPRSAEPLPEFTEGERESRSSRLMDHVGRGLVGKLIPDQTMAQGCREQYRRLAATLHETQATNGLKVVMIASAVAGEGKTLTAANLALTFSESYRRTVLLIDADLRRPSLHTVFKVEPTPGLSDGLMSATAGKLPLHRVTRRLSVLTAGRPTSDPMAGLTSDRMRLLLEEGRETFDWVIIDTPPVGLMTDANLLASMTDGTILVVKAGSTDYQAVQRAVSAIGRERLLGAVLNRAVVGPHEKKYYDYYYGHIESPVAAD